MDFTDDFHQDFPQSVAMDGRQVLMAWQDPNKVPIKAFYEGVTNAPRRWVSESMGSLGIGGGKLFNVIPGVRCDIFGWWFGTSILSFHILGMSSSQLTDIFQRGPNHQPGDIFGWWIDGD